MVKKEGAKALAVFFAASGLKKFSSSRTAKSEEKLFRVYMYSRTSVVGF